MKKIKEKSGCLILISLLFNLTISYSQPIKWEWVIQGGGTDWDHGYSITTDASNNILIRGKYSSSADFGDTTISGFNEENEYLAKYDNKGKLIWVRNIQAIASWEKDKSIVTDAQNNIYLVGYFDKETDFDDIKLTPEGEYDVCLAKLNPDGKYLWVIDAGGKLAERGYGIAVFKDKVFITGYFSDTAYFGTEKLLSRGGKDIFLACYDTSGKYKWVIQAGGANDDIAACLYADKDYIYATGNISGNVSFGGTNLYSVGSTDIFVAKYDLNGNLKWALNAGGTGDVEGKSISSDNGDVYLTGTFSGMATFNSESITAQGQSDVYLAKYSETGAFQWLINAGGSAADEGNSIVSRNNKLYITGTFGNTISFTDTSLSTEGTKDIFIACYNSSGKCLWAEKAGISSGSLTVGNGNSISLDIENNIYTGGEYSGTASFGGSNLTPKGSFDMFLCKISDLNSPLSITETKKSETLKVYPNPNKGSFNIEFIMDTESDQIEIYSTQGKLVFKSDLKNSTLIESNCFSKKFNLDYLPEGIYLIRLKKVDIPTFKMAIIK
jgi:hypothetical protein